MKRFLIAATLAIGLAVPLGACTHTNYDGTVTTGWQGFVANVGGLVGKGGGTATTANSAAAAADLYNGVAPAVAAAIRNGAFTFEQRHKIGELSAKVRGYLDEALTAESRGDNAAVAVALKGFNEFFPQLSAAIHPNGAQ